MTLTKKARREQERQQEQQARQQEERNADHAAALDFQAEIDAAVANGSIYTLMVRNMREAAQNARPTAG